MRARTPAIALSFLMLVVPGCDSGKADSDVDPQVAKAAEIAVKIQANPDAAEATLAEAGMSVEDFEALMMDIAADPAKTEAFEKAKGG